MVQAVSFEGFCLERVGVMDLNEAAAEILKEIVALIQNPYWFTDGYYSEV